MEVPQQSSLSPTTYCMWCLGIGTSRCGRCHNAYYCCRQHQIDHWSIHKKDCKKPDNTEVSPQFQVNVPTSSNQDISGYGSWCQNNISYDKANQLVLDENTYSPSTCNSVPSADKSLEFQIPIEDELFSTINSEILSSDNNFWDIINTCDAQNLFDFGTYSEKERAIAKISEALQTGAPTPTLNELSDDPLNGVQDMDLMQCASLHDICQNVVHDLTTYGICVLDKFIGARLGNMILNEVKHMYGRGIFKKGELVNPNPFLTKENIRSDVTTWINGTEPGCAAIGSLIKKLDVVVTTCNKLPNNGLLSNYKLHRRTKAMIACYPGDGTYYKKHIDNPHKDGRCITCIYYLNQNWDAKHHGGLLRMFPASHDTQVASIEPIFDRMIFFWSDKRNPHEVLPAYATRFAITVWYFDADERDIALQASREKSSHKTRIPYNN